MGLRDIAAVLTRERRSDPEPLFDMLTGRYNGVNTRLQGSTVGFDEAQAHGAVFGCVGLLSRLVAWQMPAYVGDALARATVVVAPHPEPQMTAQHWRAEMLQSALLRGYAAGLVTEFEPSGLPRKILPLHPDLVSWWDDWGRWRWYADGKDVDLWQSGGNLWVAPSLQPAPGQPVGLSTLRYAASKINLGLSATKFGGDYFNAGGMPVSKARLTDVATLSKAQADELKERILAATRNRSPLVTGSNVEFDVIKLTAEESQFLQTTQANVADVCMFFGVPPEAIGGSSGDSMTYANVEGRNLSLLTNTVGAWMQWFEALYSAMLPGVQQVTLDPEALLRTSVATLYDTAQKSVGRGNTPSILTANEARGLVGYAARADGDKLYVPVNYSPAEIIDEVVTNSGGGNSGDPFANP